MDIKITMQVDCWKRCYCGLTLTANDKGCIPSIQHRWTMAPYHATRFFFQFPELIVGFMSTLRPFLAIARTMEPLFQGGVCRAFNTRTDPEKSQAREMAKIIRLLSCLIIIIMIIIIIIIYRYFYRYPIALYNDWNQHKVLKKLIPNGRRQTSWLFTQHSWWVELEVTENESNKWQGGGLEPGTTRLQVKHPKHSATPPPWWRKWNCKVVTRDTRLVHVNVVCWYIFVTSWQSLVLRRMRHEREQTFNTVTGTNLWQSDV